MATLLFAPLPLAGHVNPTLKLAKTLRARGHRVVYCSLPDVEDTLQAEGFEFIPVFSAIFPKGLLAEMSEKASRLRGRDLRRLARDHVQRRNALLQAALDGEYDRMLKSLRPSLVLCDDRVIDLPIVCHGHGIPAVRLNTTLPPHLVHLLLAGNRKPPASARMTLLRWLEAVLARVGLMPRFQEYYQKLALKHGCQMEPVRFPPFQLPRLQDLVLFPREFAAPETPEARERVHHLGPSIDLERQEPAFPWERLQDSRPLIFFSLGTLASAELARKTLKVASAAAAQRPGWRFVLAVGALLDPVEFDGGPAGVVAVKHAPQLQLLRKAAAMVTHGGFNSVKECISFGVPMVALPMKDDQPDVTSLVVHHGLGVQGDVKQLTPGTLLSLLDTVVGSASHAQALARMGRAFREAESPEAAVATIERFLPTPHVTAAKVD
ncbi:glycosyltransferase, MGT family [Stigmatella aurantiaca]|uniref:Glycosyltransferase, MGT family n=1 Tax=Stigmatella aurantiaca TaxID=41 RepID=A0A1H8EJ49_STIAU|nr:glycosyltransferase [Stigmatella aurantiaca]SEN18887.1 glycosyltransferase, MGT family [Stigmatella aurantiaca]